MSEDILAINIMEGGAFGLVEWWEGWFGTSGAGGFLDEQVLASTIYF